MTNSKRKEKDRFPKDVTRLTGDEVMQRVFNTRIVKELKKVAQAGGPDKLKNK